MINSTLSGLILFFTFLLGIIFTQNPFIVIRLEAAWLRFASGGLFGSFLEIDPKLNEIFSLLDKPEKYAERFPEQINIIRRTGYILILVSVIGACIASCNGFQ